MGAELTRADFGLEAGYPRDWLPANLRRGVKWFAHIVSAFDLKVLTNTFVGR